MRIGAVAATLLVLTLAGCDTSPAPTTPAPRSPGPTGPVVDASSSPTASPMASPTSDPAPTPTPPSNLARVAVAERDGIRVRVRLQRNPMPAGEPSWAKAKVTNRGTTDLIWLHDGCASPAGMYAESEVAWPMGREQVGQVRKFKTYALGSYLDRDPSPFASLHFVRKRDLRTGSSGCADIGITEMIEPGQSLRITRWWSGFTDENRAIPYAGPATIHAVASHYWRKGSKARNIADRSIRVELDAWITDDAGPVRLSPAQVVDAAAADPTFAEYLDTQKLANGRAEIAWYDAERDVWEVGVMPWYEADPPRIHGVLVDPVTGAIVGPLDRPWDMDADPWP